MFENAKKVSTSKGIYDRIRKNQLPSAYLSSCIRAFGALGALPDRRPSPLSLPCPKNMRTVSGQNFCFQGNHCLRMVLPPTSTTPPSPPAASSQKTVVLDKKTVKIEDVAEVCNSSGSSVNEITDNSTSPPRSPARRRRLRTMSGNRDTACIKTPSGETIYTKGRPPWYDRTGRILNQPYVIGICGGSASGKTTVAEKIIEQLGIQWVTILSMDSFYKVLNEEQHELAAHSEYNFDHPDAFDFDLLYEVLTRLKEGKSVEVPMYDFTTHARGPVGTTMYGADVLVFEGILAFHRQDICDMMDLKIFVDTDSDTRLTRRLQRDICERGRSLKGVLDQYFRFVKPAFDHYIAPGCKIADLIVPRGGDNQVAIDIIIKKVKTQLSARGYDESRVPAQVVNMYKESPDCLKVLPSTPQVRGTLTFIRDRQTCRDQFIFYSDRLMRNLVEYALTFLPYKTKMVEMDDGVKVEGAVKDTMICGVSIMRAGETMEKSLLSVLKDCKIGKMLIQTNPNTNCPELYYLRVPPEINQCHVFVMDAIVASGEAAIMAVQILLEHDVPEENIFVLSMLMSENGVANLAYRHPRVKLITGVVDPTVSDAGHVLPGFGNFGDRYYGTNVDIDKDELQDDGDA